MFLRGTQGFKNGKKHRYWSVVGNRRTTANTAVQKTVLYLGEINDSEKAAWTRAIEELYGNHNTCQISLFPADCNPDPTLGNPAIQLRIDGIELSRPRQRGGCWLALELWERLRLDDF